MPEQKEFLDKEDAKEYASSIKAYLNNNVFDKIPSAANSSNKLTDKNYVDTLYDGASKALAYADYDTMITIFNGLNDTTYKVGQNVYIRTLNVPDLWVYEVSNTSVPYTYVDDATFVTALTTTGYVQVGYYKLAQLETQNANISNVTAGDIDSQSATNGQVLTANGSGGASWQNGVNTSDFLNLNTTEVQSYPNTITLLSGYSAYWKFRYGSNDNYIIQLSPRDTYNLCI